MRIYNAKKAQIEMPLGNGMKLVIPSNSISGEFMPNSTIISVFMTSYTPKDVAFVISGPYEIAMLSNFAGSGEYVVNSLEEAVLRFAPKVDPTTTTTTTTEAPVEVIAAEPEEVVAVNGVDEVEVPVKEEVKPKKEKAAKKKATEEKE
jgi:hypothetical protein